MSAATPAEALSQLERMATSGELEAFCNDFGIHVLVAFGSATDERRARGARDLDLAVSWREDSDRDLFGLVSELMRLLRLNEVDVLELDRAGPVARERALVGTVPLYESEAGAYNRMRDTAMLLRMDTDWLRRLDLELLAGR